MIGYKDGWKFVDKILSETFNSFPGVKIRVAVPDSSNFSSTINYLVVDKINLNATGKHHSNHYPSNFQNKEGYVWHQLLENADTEYTYVGFDLLVIDPKDVSLIRMVRTMISNQYSCS